MNKFKAFLIHFSISLMVFLGVFALVVRFWYPDLYFQTSGVWQALKMVVIVDLGLGPLMTLILYRKNKPGLKFDLSLVAGCQLVALAYGVGVLYSQKPALTVFHEGMFACLNQAQVDFAGADAHSFRRDGFEVPVAVLPRLTPSQQQVWNDQLASLPDGYPEHPAFVLGPMMRPYTGEVLDQAMADDWELANELAVNPESAAAWEAYLDRQAEQTGHRFFVWSCGPRQFMVAADPQTGRFEDILEISFLNAMRRVILALKRN